MTYGRFSESSHTDDEAKERGVGIRGQPKEGHCQWKGQLRNGPVNVGNYTPDKIIMR